MEILTQFLQTNKSVILWIGGSSATLIILTILFLPLIIINLPEYYFVKPNRVKKSQHPFIRMLIVIIKNLLGFIFVLAGIAMIFLPGQGLLTIFIGLLLCDFPNKYRFERWLIHYKPIINTINWMRLKSGKNSLQIR